MRSKRVIAAVINDLITDQRMIRICNSLQAAGYDVELVGRRLSDETVPAQSYSYKRLRFWITRGPLFYLMYNIRLFLYLMTRRFEVLHAVDLDTLPACYMAVFIKSKRLVYDAHEYFTEVPELIHRPFKQMVWKGVETALIPRVDARITVSQGIADRFEQEYGRSFEVIRNTPSMSKGESAHVSLNLPPFILYQGALNKGRGLELLIDLISDIDLDLLIVGGGDLESELKERAMVSGVDHKVHFAGIKSPTELLSIANQAVLGYNVSEPLGLSYLFSLNNKFFDYIHAELPSLTNDFPEYRKLNEQYECTLLCQPNRDDVLNKLKLLLNDKALYQKLKKNCVIAKQDLNWEEEEQKLQAVYEALF